MVTKPSRLSSARPLEAFQQIIGEDAVSPDAGKYPFLGELVRAGGRDLGDALLGVGQLGHVGVEPGGVLVSSQADSGGVAGVGEHHHLFRADGPRYGRVDLPHGKGRAVEVARLGVVAEQVEVVGIARIGRAVAREIEDHQVVLEASGQKIAHRLSDLLDRGPAVGEKDHLVCGKRAACGGQEKPGEGLGVLVRELQVGNAPAGVPHGVVLVVGNPHHHGPSAHAGADRLVAHFLDSARCRDLRGRPGIGMKNLLAFRRRSRWRKGPRTRKGAARPGTACKNWALVSCFHLGFCR